MHCTHQLDHQAPVPGTHTIGAQAVVTETEKATWTFETTFAPSSDPTPEPTVTKQTITLNNGLEMPLLGLGTAALGGSDVGEASPARKSIRWALQAGSAPSSHAASSLSTGSPCRGIGGPVNIVVPQLPAHRLGEPRRSVVSNGSLSSAASRMPRCRAAESLMSQTGRYKTEDLIPELLTELKIPREKVWIETKLHPKDLG